MKLSVLSLPLAIPLLLMRSPQVSAAPATPLPPLLSTSFPQPSAQASSPLQLAQSIWKPFAPTSGGFTVLMPGVPTTDRNTQTTQAGPIETQMYLVDRKQDLVAYMVAYSDLPTALIEQAQQSSANLQQLLNGVRDGFTESVRGTLRDQRRIELNGHPGTEISLDLPSQRTARNRIYLVNQRLYQIVVVTAKDKEPYLTKSIEGYLNSFKLVPR